MCPVGNKNIRNRQLVKKVKGRTFHLPLPLENTLSKLPHPTDPINLSDFFILLRGMPSKKNIIWEDIVNTKNVFDALTLLKMENHLYKDIKMPCELSQLLNGAEIPVYAADSSPADQVEDTMITQIADNDVDDTYGQYTCTLSTLFISTGKM